MNARYLLQFAQMTGDPHFLEAATLLLAQDENVAKALAQAGMLKSAATSVAPTAVSLTTPRMGVGAVKDRVEVKSIAVQGP